MSASPLELPVLLKVAITEYQLYPGTQGHGLSATFHPGVTVVVGINGLGKTTLLTALFRLLAGPTDWKSRPVDKPAGATPTELGPWKTPTYFQRRVADGAKRAVIIADIGFGEHVLTVKRRLHDLEILDLQLDGESQPANEEMYRAQVRALTGVKDFADFFLLLRYLVFFLEERQPVIWDRSAQFDVLRVLFFNEAQAASSRQLYDQIQSKDSHFRNLRVQHNRNESRLREAQAALDVLPSISTKIADLQTRIDAAGDRIEELETELVRLNDEYSERRQLLEREKIGLVEHLREYEFAESQYFAQLFPEIDEVANHVLVTLNGGGGCLVCGNRDSAAKRRVEMALSRGECPLCESPQETHEQIVPSQQLSDLRLNVLDASIAELRQHTRSLTEEVRALAANRQRVSRELGDEEQNLRRLKDEYQLIEGRLPPESADIALLRQMVEAGRRELARAQEQINKLEGEFGVVLMEGEKRVRDLTQRIQERFQEYAQYFLADACTLEYSLHRRRIGQDGRTFEFPSFTPSLASGVFEKLSQPRNAAHEVSESQKEFIDLAFRMALIGVALNDRSAMMVLETPEASLDVVFIARAGRLLSHFANEGSALGNRVIASSNLNSTHMIPALFGAMEKSEQEYLPALPSITLSRTERQERIVNLLDIAVPNAAMEKYGALYHQKLEDALNFEAAAPGSPTG